MQKHSDDHRWKLGRDEIATDGTVYMRRWFFWCPWFGIRVHHILRSDHDRHLHDHPWDFLSILLWGVYYEALNDGRGLRFRRWVVRHKAEDLHRLVLSKPVWTLVLTGPKRKSWGFLTEDGMVPWREYLTPNRPPRGAKE